MIRPLSFSFLCGVLCLTYACGNNESTELPPTPDAGADVRQDTGSDAPKDVAQNDAKDDTTQSDEQADTQDAGDDSQDDMDETPDIAEPPKTMTLSVQARAENSVAGFFRSGSGVSVVVDNARVAMNKPHDSCICPNTACISSASPNVTVKLAPNDVFDAFTDWDGAYWGYDDQAMCFEPRQLAPMDQFALRVDYASRLNVRSRTSGDSLVYDPTLKEQSTFKFLDSEQAIVTLKFEHPLMGKTFDVVVINNTPQSVSLHNFACGASPWLSMAAQFEGQPVTFDRPCGVPLCHTPVDVPACVACDPFNPQNAQFISSNDALENTISPYIFIKTTDAQGDECLMPHLLPKGDNNVEVNPAPVWGTPGPAVPAVLTVEEDTAFTDKIIITP